MPARAYPPEVRDRLLARVSAGEAIAAVCADPGQPSALTVSYWARRDPELAAALQVAKQAGRYNRRLRFDAAQARALLDRLAAGQSITAILRDPAMPSRRAYAHWRATHAAFAAEVSRLNQLKRDRQVARNRRRFVAFDQARADRLLVAVIRGTPLRRAPDRPASQVLARWRRERPDFDAELKEAVVFARERRLARQTLPPELMDEVWMRILHGETLATIGLDPTMPSRTTLYAWMKRNLAFRDHVALALHWRRDLLGDMAMEVGRRRSAGDTDAKREWENLYGKADRIEARLERWGYYRDESAPQPPSARAPASREYVIDHLANRRRGVDRHRGPG